MTIRATPNQLGRRVFRWQRPARQDYCLEIARGRANRKVRRVKGPVFLIGSAEDSDLVLGDTQFPEGYAYVSLRDEVLSIRWLGEGPELQVNNWPVQNSPLKIGDRISAGPFEFRVVREDSPGDGGLLVDSWRQFRIVSVDDEFDVDGRDAVQALLAQVRSGVLGLNPRRACA